MSILEHDHSPDAIRARLEQGPTNSYLRDWIYGGIDGAVTTFAVVSGVVGAQLQPSIVVVLGLANLLADGFSMAASNYTGSRAEAADEDRLREVELRHIRETPEGEREELRQIFLKKGLPEAVVAQVVESISSDHERWVRTMLTEEYGLPLASRSPWTAAMATFSAFLICGGVPLLPFLFKMPSAFALSSISTALVFFGIGCAQSRWSTAAWWRTGFSTLGIGGGAAILAWGVGRLLRGLAETGGAY